MPSVAKSIIISELTKLATPQHRRNRAAYMMLMIPSAIRPPVALGAGAYGGGGGAYGVDVVTMSFPRKYPDSRMAFVEEIRGNAS